MGMFKDKDLDTQPVFLVIFFSLILIIAFLWVSFVFWLSMIRKALLSSVTSDFCCLWILCSLELDFPISPWKGHSVQFSHSVVSNSLRPHELQHARPPSPHQLPESTQTHVHWVSDAIQPSPPLSSPSPALNLSQHQDLFKWVSSSHQVAKVLEFQLQHQSFQWTPRTDLL